MCIGFFPDFGFYVITRYVGGGLFLVHQVRGDVFYDGAFFVETASLFVRLRFWVVACFFFPRCPKGYLRSFFQLGVRVVYFVLSVGTPGLVLYFFGPTDLGDYFFLFFISVKDFADWVFSFTLFFFLRSGKILGRPSYRVVCLRSSSVGSARLASRERGRPSTRRCFLGPVRGLFLFAGFFGRVWAFVVAGTVVSCVVLVALRGQPHRTRPVRIGVWLRFLSDMAADLVVWGDGVFLKNFSGHRVFPWSGLRVLSLRFSFKVFCLFLPLPRPVGSARPFLVTDPPRLAFFAPLPRHSMSAFALWTELVSNWIV